MRARVRNFAVALTEFLSSSEEEEKKIFSEGAFLRTHIARGEFFAAYNRISRPDG